MEKLSIDCQQVLKLNLINFNDFCVEGTMGKGTRSLFQYFLQSKRFSKIFNWSFKFPNRRKNFLILKASQQIFNSFYETLSTTFYKLT